MRILVVEDDRLLNNTLCDNLEAAGYVVDSALTKSAASDFLTRQDYDLIVTGDLGMLGRTIVLDQFRRIGVDLSPVYNDCGLLIFDTKKQDVHAGGSGCGCGASVLCGYLLDKLEKRELRRLLFCATGALLSPTSSWQGESIPGVCHAVAITAEGV